MENYPDNQLVSQYLKGNKTALEVLISRYLRSIYGFIYHYVGNASDAEDITQNVFIKLWRNLKKFDQGKNFKTWLFSIAKNTAIDSLRQKKMIPFSDLENDEDEESFSDNIPDIAPLPDEILEQKNIGKNLDEAIKKLPSKYRVAVLMHYRDEFIFEEMAEILDEPLNTLKSRARRGLAILRTNLLEKDDLHQK